MKTYVAEEMPELFWKLIFEKGWQDFFYQHFISDAEIVIIRTKTQADRDFLAKFPRLRLLIRAGTGFDNIDIMEAEKRSIYVCNTPEANAVSAFEHTISFIFALIKQHGIAQTNMLEGRWKTGLKNNWEMSDIKALIVGVGRVGTRVAKALQYFGAEVKGCDPYLSDSAWQDKKIDSISFHEGLSWCNLLSFHCPLSQETREYFCDSSLDFLQNPIWLINTARGGIVSQTTLKKGLKNGMITGYAADVFTIEPLPEIEFSDYENVLLTPHVGSFTNQAKERLSVEVLAVWKAFIFQNELINPIDKRFF